MVSMKGMKTKGDRKKAIENIVDIKPMYAPLLSSFARKMDRVEMNGKFIISPMEITKLKSMIDNQTNGNSKIRNRNERPIKMAPQTIGLYASFLFSKKKMMGISVKAISKPFIIKKYPISISVKW